MASLARTLEPPPCSLILLLFLVSTAVAFPAWCGPTSLSLQVIDVRGRPLDDVFIGLAGPESEERTASGGVALPLAHGTDPGETVQLEVNDPVYVLVSPWHGQVQVPAEGSSIPVLVVLGSRGDRALLESGDALRSFVEQVLSSYTSRADGDGSSEPGQRLDLLTELGERYGLEPEQIDRALRAWRDPPLGLTDRRLLEGYLSLFPSEIVAREGSLVFAAPVEMRDPIFIMHPDGPVTIGNDEPRFFLRADLSALALGESTTLAIDASPPEALTGSECSWVFAPDDFLRITGDGEGGCRLEAAMPELPRPGWPLLVPLQVTARISREGKMIDEITTETQLRNGVAIGAVIQGGPLTPTGSVAISIVAQGEAASLADGYECSWSSGGVPILLRQAAANGCQGIVAFKPEEDWTLAESTAWLSHREIGTLPAWTVRVSYRDNPLPDGVLSVEVPVADDRSLEALRSLMLERGRVSGEEMRLEMILRHTDAALIQQGFPVLEDFDPSQLSLGVRVDRGRFRLHTVFVHGDRGTEPQILDHQRELLKVLYSVDGESFFHGDYGGGQRDLLELATLDHVWVRLESPVAPEVAAGPFRLPIDAESELHEAVVARWTRLNPDERTRIACSGFVTGPELVEPAEIQQLLTIIEAVDVRPVAGSLWRTRTYGEGLAPVRENAFEALPEPVGWSGHVVRIRFRGGPAEEFECDRRFTHRPQHVGLHHLLSIAERGDFPDLPPHLEVFVEEEWNGGWKIYFDRSFDPAYVRVSTDGEEFRTIRQDYRNEGSVTVEELKGDVLVLRFVDEEGREVAYRGALDFDQHRRRVLLENLLVSLEPSCERVEPEGLQDPTGGARVLCTILTSRGWGMHRGGPIKLSHVLPMLRHIQFGCARDLLDRREDYRDLRAPDAEIGHTYLRFGLAETCDTVFAKLVLTDDSESQVLAIPVLTGEFDGSYDETPNR